ncbi:MAG: aldehyde dehydrogenase family protein, partial [Rubrivivax sp.]
MPSEHGKLSLAMRRPMGVITCISPWNFPGILTARGIAFALAAGNTVVLKPSEETPYCGGLFFAEVFQEAGVPAGVLNVLTCSRENIGAIGDELIDNPRIKGISFTGSTPVGRMIAARAGAHLKKACVELGGKDSLIVCDDADMERATQAANFGSFMHQGQICMSVEKVLVQDRIFEPFVKRFVERAAKLKMGDPSRDDSCVIGPLINDKQAAKVKEQIDDAVAKGAKVLLGGGVKGRFVEPTILLGVTPQMKVYQEETFGPVVPVIPFRTDDEAIAPLRAALALLEASAHPEVDNLADWLLVSQLQIDGAPAAGVLAKASEAGVTVQVARAVGEKCERCWHYETDVTEHQLTAEVSGR